MVASEQVHFSFSVFSVFDFSLLPFLQVSSLLRLENTSKIIWSYCPPEIHTEEIQNEQFCSFMHSFYCMVSFNCTSRKIKRGYSLVPQPARCCMHSQQGIPTNIYFWHTFTVINQKRKKKECIIDKSNRWKCPTAMTWDKVTCPVNDYLHGCSKQFRGDADISFCLLWRILVHLLLEVLSSFACTQLEQRVLSFF